MESLTAPTWAIVELMGYCKLAGRLSEEEKFGAKIGRIDVPTGPGEFRVHYFTPASIYRITIVTEEMVREQTALPKQLDYIDRYMQDVHEGEDEETPRPRYL